MCKILCTYRVNSFHAQYRKFDVAAELGCGRGHVGKHIYSDMVGTYYQCDFAEKVLVSGMIYMYICTLYINLELLLKTDYRHPNL